MKDSNLAFDMDIEQPAPAARQHERPALHVVARSARTARGKSRRRPFRLQLSNNGHRPFRTF